MQKIKFINSYSFIFSSRPGTPAANLKKIDDKIAKNRLEKFQALANEIKNDYKKNLVNTTLKVLFENKTKDSNKYFGRDEHYNSVIVESNENLNGKIKDVKVNKCNHNTLFGAVVLNKRFEEYAA